jgi:predicted phosphodiesterase
MGTIRAFYGLLSLADAIVRYLILSDIHANWEALKAVSEHARGRYDQILCCGDIVGYGADPNITTEWVRKNAQVVIRGNHDKAGVGMEDLEWFNPVARMAAMWTQAALKPENLSYLRSLPKGPIAVGDFQVFHGSPLDEDEYLVGPYDVAQLYGYLETPVSFFGHSHLQGGFFVHRNGTRAIDGVALEEDRREVELERDVLYLINVGSVGQPRDGDARAAYVLYKPEERLVTYCRVPYDVATAQRKIIEAGLPDLLAWRLAKGT